MSDRLLSHTEAGKRLARHGYLLAQLIRRNEIGFHRDGAKKLIPESEVLRFEQAHKAAS